MSTSSTAAVFPVYCLVSAAGDATSSARPHWVQALLAETYPVAFTLCFAIFAWRYNARILIQCLLICYGLSLRAFARMLRATHRAETEKSDYRAEV